MHMRWLLFGDWKRLKKLLAVHFLCFYEWYTIGVMLWSQNTCTWHHIDEKILKCQSTRLIARKLCSVSLHLNTHTICTCTWGFHSKVTPEGVSGIIKGFWGDWNFQFQYFGGVGKFGKYFMCGLISVGIFWGVSQTIWRFMVAPLPSS